MRQIAADGVVSPVTERAFRVAFSLAVRERPTVAAPAGPLRPGATLTARPGAYAGTAPVTSALQWERCRGEACQPIAGAVGATYAVAAADVGAAVRVAETATNEVGPLRTLSLATAVVEPTPVPDVLLDRAPDVVPPRPVPAGTGRLASTPTVQGFGRRITARVTASGAGTIEAVATHAGPERARPRALAPLKAGPSRLVYPRAKPRRVAAPGRHALRLVRTVGGRDAGFRGRVITVRLTVRFVPDGGRPVTTVRNVRLRLRR